MLDAYLMTLCIQMEYPWTATSTEMAVPGAPRNPQESPGIPWNPLESPGTPLKSPGTYTDSNALSYIDS